MDWTAAIERNRTALLAVAGAIAALIGGRDGEGRIARGLRSAALALLRPAESALRRLIIIAARGLAATLRPSRRMLQRPIGSASPSDRTPAFRLTDPAMRFVPLSRVRSGGIPRIRTFWNFGDSALFRHANKAHCHRNSRNSDPEALVDVRRLRLRLGALEAALSDLPRQARRLARLRARWTLRPVAPGALPRTPLRIGHPPGHGRNPTDEVDRDIDDVLRDCHALALDAWAQPVRPRRESS
jgi:hypothetical protein